MLFILVNSLAQLALISLVSTHKVINVDAMTHAIFYLFSSRVGLTTKTNNRETLPKETKEYTHSAIVNSTCSSLNELVKLTF